jgi:hypothetical protein
MVDANLTYLDSLNRYIVVWSYKALTGLSERSMVSTEPRKKQQSVSAKTDVEFIHKYIRLGVMVFDGIGTQVPRSVGGIC